MTGRPCKPDADLKGLWRTLLGTPFPACGITEGGDVAGSNRAESNRSENQHVKLDAKVAVREA